VGYIARGRVRDCCWGRIVRYGVGIVLRVDMLCGWRVLRRCKALLVRRKFQRNCRQRVGLDLWVPTSGQDLGRCGVSFGTFSDPLRQGIIYVMGLWWQGVSSVVIRASVDGIDQ
jgi:hypothetical protein